MKVGIIRCMHTEDICPATTCLKVMKEKKLAFEDVEDEIELIGVNTCGGCPVKKAITRAQEMVKRGADTIVMALYYKRKPYWFSCTHVEKMKEAIAKKLGDSIKIIDYTH